MLRPVSARRRQAGLTLTELMLAIAVLGVLIGLALPNFFTMLRNYQVRVAAESVANGMQRARAEAVTKNASMQFVLGTGTSWTVDYVTKPVATDPPLDSRLSTEGSNLAAPVAVASDLATAATTITFNNLGQTIANADASPTLSRITFTVPGGNQTLQVRIGAGGGAKVCDPALPAGNARAC